MTIDDLRRYRPFHMFPYRQAEVLQPREELDRDTAQVWHLQGEWAAIMGCQSHNYQTFAVARVVGGPGPIGYEVLFVKFADFTVLVGPNAV